MGSIETTWKPRGSLNKNSLSADLVEQMVGSLDSWTDTSYGDSLGRAEAATLLAEGLREEVEIAVSAFLTENVF